MKTFKEKYIKYLSDKITVSIDDLTDNELKLMNESFEMFNEKLEEIKILSDELRSVNIQLMNIKSMNDGMVIYKRIN